MRTPQLSIRTFLFISLLIALIFTGGEAISGMNMGIWSSLKPGARKSMPAVSATDPESNSQNGRRNWIRIDFDQIMDTTLLQKDGFTLTDSSGAVVEGNLYFINGLHLSFMPFKGLKFGTYYTATLKSDAVKNLSGKHLGKDYSWSFTTEADSGETNQPSLKYDAEDHRIRSVKGKLDITNGRMKAGIAVTPGQFFTRYRVDFQLTPQDVALKDLSPLKINGVMYQGFRQLFRTADGETLFVVDQSRALLTVSEGNVVSFSQNFVPGLDKVFKDAASTTPLIKQEAAYKIAQKELGLIQEMTAPVQEVTAPLFSLLPMRASTKSRTADSLTNTNNSAATTAIPADQTLALGGPNSMAPAPIDDTLIIGFDGPREAKYARLMWNFRIDLGGLGGKRIATVHVDAMTGKVVSTSDNIHYDELSGNNIPCTGIPYPFYDVTTPVGFWANENINKNKNNEPYYDLSCRKTDGATSENDGCPNNLVVVSSLGNKTGKPDDYNWVTNNDTFFEEKDQPVPVSIFLDLQIAGYYFLNNFNWIGFQDKPDDVIRAYVGTRINPFNKTPSAGYYAAPPGSGPGYILFDGHGNDKMTPIASLDVVGHEFFHGIFHYLKGEADWDMETINEGLADFFGKVMEDERVGMTETKIKPPLATKWKLGAQLFGGNGSKGFLRDLADPASKQFPAMYDGLYYVNDQDCKGAGYCYQQPPPAPEVACNDSKTGYCDRLHRNSTVISHMLQLLADGGPVKNELNHQMTIKGVGTKAAARIAWETWPTLLPTETMKDFCKNALKAAKELSETGNVDPAVKDTLVDSTRDACQAVNLMDQDDNRFYEPSKKTSGYMNVDPWPVTLNTLKWEVFLDGKSDEKEDKWRVEVSNFPPDVEFTPDPEEDYHSYSAFTTTSAPEGGKNLAQAQFVLTPDKPYWWRICPGYADNDKDVAPDSKALPGKDLINEESCPNGWREVQFFNTGKKVAKLISPQDGEYIAYTDKGVDFTWEEVPGATLYNIAYHEDSSSESTAELHAVIKPPATTYHDPAAGKEPLCWAIINANSSKPDQTENGDESKINCYKIKPAQVELDSPKGEIPYSTSDLKFTWKKAGAADSYHFTLCDRDPNTNQPKCADNEFSTDTTAPSYFLPGVATGPDGDCWQVTGKTKDGIEGEPSDWACYSIKPPAVTTVTLMNPLDGATDVNNTTTSFSFKYSAPYSPSEETKGSNAILVSHKGGAIIRELPDGESPPSWDQYPPGSPKPTDSIKGNIGTDFPDLDHEGNYIFGGGLVGPLNLKPSTTYYWQAYQLDKDEQTILASSNIWTFKTKKLALCGDMIPDVPEEQCDLGPQNGPGSGCDKNCTLPVCGNNITDPPNEQCDGSDLAGATCQSQGFDTGALSCTNCAFNTSNCAKCGNTKVEPGETCEPPNTATCDAACHIKCGNAVIDAGEECDDGNKSDNDTCKNDCKKNICGDGVPGGPGEECDDGNVQGGDGCSATCKKDCNALDLHTPTWNPDNKAYFEGNPNYSYSDTDPTTNITLIYPILGPVSNNMTLHYDCGKGAAFYSVALDVFDLENQTWANDAVVSPPIDHNAAYTLVYPQGSSVKYYADGTPYYKYLYNFRARCEDKCGTWTDWGPFDKGGTGIMHFYSPLTVGNMPVLKKKPLQSITPPAVK